MQFLYKDEAGFDFMDQGSYEQIAIAESVVGEEARFLKENLVADVLLFEERPVSIGLPNFVELEVTETEPGVKGDTVEHNRGRRGVQRRHRTDHV